MLVLTLEVIEWKRITWEYRGYLLRLVTGLGAAQRRNTSS